MDHILASSIQHGALEKYLFNFCNPELLTRTISHIRAFWNGFTAAQTICWAQKKLHQKMMCSQNDGSTFAEAACDVPQLSDICLDQIVGSGSRLLYKNINRFPENVLEKLIQRLVEANRLTDTTAVRSLTKERTSITWTGATGLRRAIFSEIPRRCPNLQELRLEWCKQVDNRTVRALLHSCRNLRILRLDGCQRISDSAFVSQPFDIMYGLMELIEIGLSQCPQITDETLHVLVKKCPKLQILDIARNRRITDVPVRDLLDCCRSLTQLNVEFCSRLTDQPLVSFLAVASPCAQQADSRELCNGKLSDVHTSSFGGSVDDLCLEKLFWGGIKTSFNHLQCLTVVAPLLQVLDLRWCPGVTDASLKAFYAEHSEGANCRLGNLHTLCLRGCAGKVCWLGSCYSYELLTP